ncbi:hypothetical protein B0J13DRAFT_526039 [Dactylonectria estremocensis]|uniref:Uncharacterized protein n=1 Tax=Dactylonectria estremocensis TaxID=1079267 RepID=A0A9P9ERM3_9HYPO|nr:hypothetical protein B0J13DRAFT_526039 [Dactylonectria estremocensis]
MSPDELMQMERDGGGAIKAIWKQIYAPPPAWIQQIVDAQQPWGFVFYKSREVERKYGHAWDENWRRDIIQENTNRIPYPFKGERPHEYTRLDYIHSGGNEPTLKRLWTNDLTAGPISQDLPEDNALRRGPTRGTFCVWAYDADWEPSSTDVTLPNGEGYRGRVKVPIYSLNAWFYVARYEGVSVKDMWLKAQTHHLKLWICYLKPIENWHHESDI